MQRRVLDPVERATRNAVRVWMREVLDRHEWSAAEWAHRAGTTPTNITRVLDPSSTIIPSAVVLSRLAKVAGTQPNLLAFVRRPAVRSHAQHAHA